MLSRLSAFVIWALVGGSTMFWGLRLTANPLQVPSHAIAVGDSATAHADLTRLFGATPVVAVATAAATEAASRFQLLGIIAPRARGTAVPSHSGVALIAVDGKLPRAFTVGARVDDDLVLQSVSLRTASIGPAQGARSVLLELPALPPPATGVLPAAGGVPSPRPVSPIAPQPVRPVAPPQSIAPAAARAVLPSNGPAIMNVPPRSLPIGAPPSQNDAAMRRQ